MRISERAKSIAEWHSCITKQGKRTDLLSEIERLKNEENAQGNANDFCPPNADEIKADGTSGHSGLEVDLNPRSIIRYVRIALLINSLLERVDNGIISIRAAVELSYLSEEQQINLDTVLCSA